MDRSNAPSRLSSGHSPAASASQLHPGCSIFRVQQKSFGSGSTAESRELHLHRSSSSLLSSRHPSARSTIQTRDDSNASHSAPRSVSTARKTSALPLSDQSSTRRSDEC